MLNCGVPWVADGYHGLACKSHTGRRRSVPVALLEVERGISVDTQLMLGLQPSTPVNRQKARVQSANIVRLHPKVKHAEHTRFHSGFRGSQRPSSGHLAQRRKSQTPTRRPVSARAQFRSTTPKPSKTVHGRPMSAPVTRPSSSCGSFADPKDPSMRRPWSTTGRGPAPGHHYLDRHARCLGNTHIHQDLLRMRPRMACDHPGSVCPDRDVCQRADKSKTIMEKEADRRATRHEQYVNNLRPRTAPPAVRRSGHIRHNDVIRGAVPHFCNFIRSKLIHDKALSTEDILKIDDDDRPPRPKEAFAADDTINYDVLDLGSQQEKTEGLKESIQTSPRNGLPSDKELIEPCPPEPAFEPHEEAGEEAPVVQEDIRVEYREELAEEPKKVEVKKLDGETIRGNQSQPSSFVPNLDLKTDVVIPPESPGNAWQCDDDSQPQLPAFDRDLPLEQATGSDVEWKTYELKPKKDVSIEVPSSSEDAVSPRPPAPGDSLRRQCHHKKTRRLIERKERKTMEKPKETPKETPKAKAEEAADQDSGVSTLNGSTNPLPTVPPSIPVPDLPAFDPNDRRSEDRAARLASRIGKVKKHFITMEDPKTAVSDSEKEFVKEKPKLQPQFNFEVQAKEDYSSYQKTSKPQWQQGRLALSNQSSRFELPMDMKRLEAMTPQDYLRQFCFISTRRHTLYQKIFLKCKDKCGCLLIRDLEKALKEVLINTISREDMDSLFNLAQIDENSKVDLKLFSGIAALAERILYPDFLTEDTEDLSEHQKEKIECADFSALKWKLNGVDVNPAIRRILHSL